MSKKQIKKTIFIFSLSFLFPIFLQAQGLKAVSLNGTAFYGLNAGAGDSLWHGIIGGGGLGFDFSLFEGIDVSLHASISGQNYFLPPTPVNTSETGDTYNSFLQLQSIQGALRFESPQFFDVEPLYAGAGAIYFFNRGGSIKNASETNFSQALPFLGTYLSLFIGYFFEDIQLLGWTFGTEFQINHPLVENRFEAGLYLRLKNNLSGTGSARSSRRSSRR